MPILCRRRAGLRALPPCAGRLSRGPSVGAKLAARVDTSWAVAGGKRRSRQALPSCTPCRFLHPIRPFSGVLFRPSAKVQRVFRKSAESFRQKCQEFSSKLPRVFGKSVKGFGEKSPVFSDNPQRFRPRPQARERKSPSTLGRKLSGCQEKPSTSSRKLRASKEKPSALPCESVEGSVSELRQRTSCPAA